MPIEYNISQNGLRIETFPRGELDFKTTIEYFEKLMRDKRIKQGAIEIVYFKYVTDFKISHKDGDRIAEGYKEPKTLRLIKATIFVCETFIAYGIGRTLQAFHDLINPDHSVHVVKSESELEDVLKGYNFQNNASE